MQTKKFIKTPFVLIRFKQCPGPVHSPLQSLHYLPTEFKTLVVFVGIVAENFLLPCITKMIFQKKKKTEKPKRKRAKKMETQLTVNVTEK